MSEPNADNESTERRPPDPERGGVRDPVLEREWFAVARSADVGTDPVRAELMGEPLVLWRTAEGLHAFRDLCIHRGTALSLGRVEDGELVCPYHGWRYDASGRCTRIPAQPPERTIPTKARAWAYPCRERQGLVWVGFDPQGTPPGLDEADAEGFRTVIAGPYRLAAEAPRVIENFLDVSHLMWVHEGYLGVTDHAEIPDYQVREEDGVLVSDPIPVYQPDPDGRGKVLTNRYVYKVLRPLTARFAKDDAGEVFAMMIQVTPLGPRRSLAWGLIARNYDLDGDDHTYTSFQDTIMGQDQPIVESQRPEELPLDLQAELHLTSDRLAIAYRRYLRARGVTAGVA